VFDSLYRKLRGIVGTAVTWAVGWGLTASAVQGVLSLFGIADPPSLVRTMVWGLMGLYGGAVFGLFTAITERRRTLLTLSPARMALLGGAAGFVIPVVYNVMRGDLHSLQLVPLAVTAAIVAPLTALSAGVMTAIAQGKSLLPRTSRTHPLPAGEELSAKAP
jgi:hypothetical protein